MEEVKHQTLSTRGFLKYETVLWTVHSIVTILAIVDRFTTNINPRQTYIIGKGFAGKDRMGPPMEGPWSVALYDILARISGRYCIVVYNFTLIVRYVSLVFIAFLLNQIIMKKQTHHQYYDTATPTATFSLLVLPAVMLFVFRLHMLEQYLASSWISKHILDCSNITKANLEAHRINGIGLVVMTLIHIWSILLPCVTHNYGSQVLVGTFEWFLSERTPPWL